MTVFLCTTMPVYLLGSGKGNLFDCIAAISRFWLRAILISNLLRLFLINRYPILLLIELVINLMY